MKIFDKKISEAFTVIEVLVATVTIVIVIGAAVLSTRSSIRADQDALDYGVARNLAEEGIEMVRNVRDTNWLKYSAFAGNCWNYWLQADRKIDNPDPRGACTDADTVEQKIRTGVYTVHINPADKKLVLQGSNDDAVNDDQPFVKGDYGTDQEDFRIAKVYLNDDLDRIVFFANLANMNMFDIALYTNFEATKFYRQVKVQYLDPTTQSPLVNDQDVSDLMEVSSLAFWMDRGQQRKVELKSILTNYQE